MKKALSLILALVLCLSLCACGGDTQALQNGGESTISENSGGGNADNTTQQVDAEYIAMVCGKWELISGWRDLGDVLEFREDGIFVFNEEELKWDAAFKDKQWLDEPKEFVNIYRNNELVYEAHINVEPDGTIMLVISERDDAGLGYVPAGTYEKLGDTENSQVEAPNHPLVQDICREWEAGNDQAPFQSLTISEDGSCVVDGTPATWKIENSYTTDTDLSIRVYMDGKICFGMVYYSRSGTALLTMAMDDTFENSPMYIAACTIEKATETVEITLDNWQDYFEIVLSVWSITENAFGEITRFTPSNTFVLKEEWRDCVTDVDIAVEGFFKMCCNCKFSYNTDTGELVILEMEEKYEYKNTFIFDADLQDVLDDAFSLDKAYSNAETLTLEGNVAIIWCEYFSDVEMVRIQGTISIEE